jgi:hypothetical protein
MILGLRWVVAVLVDKKPAEAILDDGQPRRFRDLPEFAQKAPTLSVNEF